MPCEFCGLHERQAEATGKPAGTLHCRPHLTCVPSNCMRMTATRFDLLTHHAAGFCCRVLPHLRQLADEGDATLALRIQLGLNALLPVRLVRKRLRQRLTTDKSSASTRCRCSSDSVARDRSLSLNTQLPVSVVCSEPAPAHSRGMCQTVVQQLHSNLQLLLVNLNAQSGHQLHAQSSVSVWLPMRCSLVLQQQP